MMKKKYAFFLAALAALAADQAAKIIALSSLTYRTPVSIIPGIMDIYLTFNTGATFGTFKGYNVIFMLLSVLAAALLVAYRKNLPGPQAAGGLILGGVLGNLADRARLGFVVDFIDFRIWPVFNLADAFLTTGVIIAAIAILREKK